MCPPPSPHKPHGVSTPCHALIQLLLIARVTHARSRPTERLHGRAAKGLRPRLVRFDALLPQLFPNAICGAGDSAPSGPQHAASVARAQARALQYDRARVGARAPRGGGAILDFAT